MNDLFSERESPRARMRARWLRKGSSVARDFHPVLPRSGLIKKALFNTRGFLSKDFVSLGCGFFRRTSENLQESELSKISCWRARSQGG